MSNISPFCYHHFMNPKSSANNQLPAGATFFTIKQVLGTSAYIAHPRLDIQHDTSPFPNDVTSSTASSDYADSTSSRTDSQDSYHQQEEPGYLADHVAVASFSESSQCSPPQIISLGDSDSENLGDNAIGTLSLADLCGHNFASTIRQQSQSQRFPKYSVQSAGLLSQASSDVSVAAYQAYCPSAMKLCSLQKRCLSRKEKVLSTANLRFGAEARFESIVTPAAASFCVYQSPNRFLIPMRIETYNHCLESFSAQLAQSQLTSAQVHRVPEFETTCSISNFSPFAANTKNVEVLGACDNIRTDGQSISSVPHEVDSRTSNIPESAADKNDYPTVDKPKKLMQDHFLDEDSLLENLPKFEHSNASDLPCELKHNVNWLQPKSPNAKPDFEICGSDGYFAKQRKQILQTRNLHRSTGISTRGANEGRPGGLTPMPPYHQSNDSNWHKHSQNGPLSKNYLARSFSTSDGFVRNQERNSYDNTITDEALNFPRFSGTECRTVLFQKLLQICIVDKESCLINRFRFYVGNMNRSHDRSQCSSSDRRFTPKMTIVHRSANKSSFISHDKNDSTYYDRNTENSFILVTSDDKRSHGTTASLHRNVKRNGANKSRNSPPVYLALKSHREFVAINGAEMEAIGSTPKEKSFERNRSPQRIIERTQKKAQDVEQLTGLFCEHVAVCGEGVHYEGIIRTMTVCMSDMFEGLLHLIQSGATDKHKML